MHLWIGTVDGLLSSEVVDQAFADQLPSAAIQLMVPPPRYGLPTLLRLSQVVVIVDLVDQKGDGRHAMGPCRQVRLAPKQALAQHTTICLNTPEQGDGLVGHPQRYAGFSRLEPEADRHPIHALQRFTHRWRAFGQDPCGSPSSSGLTTKGWSTAVAVAWALGEAQALLQRSDRWLLIKALGLALVLVGFHLWLRQLTTSFLPSLLLLAAGASWLSAQPLRQRAQQWWCLGQGIWLQDTWHRLGIHDEVAVRLPPQQRLDDHSDRGQLLHLLHSHQLLLALEGVAAPWCRDDLSDGLAGLEQHLALMQAAIQKRKAVQGAMLIPTLVCAGLAVVAVVHADTLPIELVVLVAGVALSALWLDRPLPLGRRERLQRYVVRELESGITDLKRLLLGSDLSDPNLRGEIMGRFHLIGEQLLDLCNDALEASTWTWSLQP